MSFLLPLEKFLLTKIEELNFPVNNQTLYNLCVKENLEEYRTSDFWNNYSAKDIKLLVSEQSKQGNKVPSIYKINNTMLVLEKLGFVKKRLASSNKTKYYWVLKNSEVGVTDES